MNSRVDPSVGEYGLAVLSAWPWPARNGITSKTSQLFNGLAIPLHVFSPEAGEHPSLVIPHETLRLASRSRFFRTLSALKGRSVVVPPGLEVEAVLPGIKSVLITAGEPAFVHLDTITTGHLVQPIQELFHELGMSAPIVLSINDSYSHLLRDVSRLKFPPARWLQFLYMILVERHLLVQADLVDVVSNVDYRWLSRVVPKARLRLLPLGVSPVPVSERQPSSSQDILLFGSRAGLEPLMEDLYTSWQRLQFSIAMIGPQPTEKTMHTLTKMGGRYAGYVDDLPTEFRSSRVVVAPSQQRSGLSTKGLHAMAVGVPVAGGRCLLGIPGFTPGVHGLYSDSGIGLVRAIVEGLANEATLAEVGAAGRALAESMPTWEDVCALYLATLPDR